MMTIFIVLLIRNGGVTWEKGREKMTVILIMNVSIVTPIPTWEKGHERVNCPSDLFRNRKVRRGTMVPSGIIRSRHLGKE
mmetsp:Transcript_21069/g.34823  ORF Transcript_21069/g.34823 Transcript_21069/m.34823 type:complete len:80 (+) Transcript_21069:774-1013(+)